MSFDVHVVNDEQEGVDGAKVMLSFTSVLRGVSGTEYTDEDGHAEFDGFEDGEITVYVNGTGYGTYSYEDGDSVTITI